MLKFVTNLQVRANEIKAREEGASMVEYGLLVAGIAVVVGAAVFTLGDNIAAMFDAIDLAG